MAAVRKLQDPSSLCEVLELTPHPRIAKFAMGRIEDPTLIAQACKKSKLLLVRSSEQVRNDEFGPMRDLLRPTSDKPAPIAQSEYLGGLAYLPRSDDMASTIRGACREAIRLGNDSCMPALVDLLNTYGDEDLGRDYLACQHPILATAARNWGNQHQKGMYLMESRTPLLWGEKPLEGKPWEEKL